MKAISVHVSEEPYQEMKSLARRRGVPVAQVLRQAMHEYLERENRTGGSVLDLPPHDSGRLRKRWNRSDLLDEMRER